VPILIVKKDGRREPFDRQKLLRGIMSACQKRPVSLGRLEEAAGDIQAKLMELPDREVPSRQLGELVMDSLKQIDSVAYVRFASVYRDFKDLPDFVKALEGLMPGSPPPVPRITPREARLEPAPRITPREARLEPVPRITPREARLEPAPRTPSPEPEPVRRSTPAPRPEPARQPPSSEPLPFKSTPLFPGVDPERPGPAKRRKSR
jgi:hypothetical protein